MAKMVRGLSAPAALSLLQKTSKKSARLFEGVLRSAMANAEHNFKQDPRALVIQSVVVNQGAAYRRGIPMARGRVRPIKKFLCHIAITLGLPDAEMEVKGKKESARKQASKAKKADKQKKSSSVSSS